MKTKITILSVLLFSCIAFSAFINAGLQSKPWDVPAKYQKLKNPYAQAEDTQFVGKTLFRLHCSSCHGKKGMGDGTKAKQLKTPMPDFTQSSFKEQCDGSIYYKSFIGRDEMPGFEKKIAEEEDRWLLVNYIKGMKKD